MKVITRWADILSVLCKHYKKWGIYFSGTYPNDLTQVEAIQLAAPWLKNIKRNERMDVIFEGSGYLLFDSEKDMEKAYKSTVSDDYPRDNLPHIYMLTCDPKGQLLTENT